MSIKFTYSTLIAALENYIEDKDEEFKGVLPVIVALAEHRVARDLKLELHNTDTGAASVDNTARTFTISTSIVEVLDLYDPTTGEPVIPRAVSFVKQMGGSLPAGKPLYWARTSKNTILFAPKFSGTPVLYWMRVEKLPEALTPTNPVTFMSDQMGDVLFAAGLIECERYNKNSKAQAEREADYKRVLAQRLDHAVHSTTKRYDPLTSTPLAKPTDLEKSEAVM